MSREYWAQTLVGLSLYLIVTGVPAIWILGREFSVIHERLAILETHQLINTRSSDDLRQAVNSLTAATSSINAAQIKAQQWIELYLQRLPKQHPSIPTPAD